MLVGNLFDLEAGHPVESLMELARTYGPIYELDLPGGRSLTIVSSFDLVDELCDESGFDKRQGPIDARSGRTPRRDKAVNR
jgi:cytochrome P450/NADPH-cytochrome P450 reductase